MKVKVNIDNRGFTSKPKGPTIGGISNRTRQEAGQKELEPTELINLIKRGYTFTPGVIGGSAEEHKARQARHDTNLEPYWQSMQIIAIDIDNEQDNKPIKHELTPGAALEACKGAGIMPICIYKTFGYTPEHEKYRVLILLEDALTNFGKAYEYIERCNNLFNRAIAATYTAQGLTPEVCTDGTIEPVKLIFGGRPDCVIYQPDIITPTANRIIEALPTTPENGPTSASKAQAQKDTPKASKAQTGPTGAENERDLIISALFAINPASLNYENWRDIGAALKYEGIEYSIFDQWSAHDTGTNEHGQPRYNEQANYKIWQGWSEPGQRGGKARTAGTIFYHARQYGWNFPQKEYFTPEERADMLQSWEDMPEHISAADFPPDFFEDPNETETQTPGDTPTMEDINNLKSIEENAPPAKAEPKQEPKPAPMINAADYFTCGYDADISELKKYANRKIGLHPDIDRYLTLYPGLAILGGQASLGKTTFCVNVAAKLLERGEHVLYFTLEQTAAEIMTKFAARYIYEHDKYTEIDNIKLKNGAADPETYEMLNIDFSEGLKNLFIIQSDFEVTVNGIAQTIDNYIKTTGVKPIVIIDYLQIIAPATDNHGSKADYIDENLKALKKYQRDNNLFVLLISSFNRANNYEPISYESFLHTSAIEFTCDYVFGLQLQILDPDNEEFYTKKGKQGGEYEQKSYEKKKKVHEAQSQIEPKKVQFVSLKNRNGKQFFKANFGYYPAHDYYEPDYTQEWSRHPYNDTFKNVL